MASTAPFPAPRPVHRPHPRTAALTIRLTTRGRVLLLVVTILALFTVVVASGRLTAEATSPQVSTQGSLDRPRPAAAVVVVQPGESLWSIAQQVAPNSDPREIVSRIRDLNGLADAVVTPGQAVLVPVVD